MRGIILEKENNRIVVLTKDGRFIKRKITTEKEIGDEINISNVGYKQIMSIAAALVVVFIVTFRSYAVYAQPYGYVQIEGDSGIELTYNKQFKVINAESINDNEEEINQEIIEDLKGKKIEEAISLTTSKVLENQESTVVITCTSLDKDVKEAIVNEFQQKEIEEKEVIILNVEKEDYENARKNNINPAEENLRQKLSEKNVSEEELKEMDSVKDLVHKINTIRKEEKDKIKEERKNNKNINKKEAKEIKSNKHDKENQNIINNSKDNKVNKDNRNKIKDNKNKIKDNRGHSKRNN